MQVLPQQAMGYDRAITVFSPDGRLLQVEYAKKAVGVGAMTIGLVYKDGVLLIADRRIIDKLVIPESIKKISEIDAHIISTFSGLTSDARVLVKKCRLYAQQHRMTYGEPIDIEGVVKYISDLGQAFTQYAGMRPFGVSFLMAGVDIKGEQLFVTDPTGVYSKYKARAIGLGSTNANELLVKRYKPDLKLDAILKLAVDIFKEVMQKEFSYDRLEASIVTSKGVQKLDLKKEQQ